MKDILLDDSILEQYFHKEYAVFIARGLQELVNKFPVLQQESHGIEIVGPTIEGVGYYPIVDEQLKIRDHAIYVAGDSVGSFRGITAAMLSGYYVGEQIINSKSMARRSYEYLQST